jgi:bla regulator protein blaR1
MSSSFGQPGTSIERSHSRKDTSSIVLKLLLLAIASAVPAVSLAQSTMPRWQKDAGGTMSFEVASIHPSQPGTFTPPNFPLSPDDAFTRTGGMFAADFPLLVYITFAYKLSPLAVQMKLLSGELPKWAETESFTIHAKAVGDPTKDQMRLMVQRLLADRFKLATHDEERLVPVFALTLVKPAKLGPRLRPHAEGPPCAAPVSSPAKNSSSADGSDEFPAVCDVYAAEGTPVHTILFGSRNTTMELIADNLPTVGHLGRPGVNRTGLSGRFDFSLEWTPERNNPAAGGADAQPELEGTTFLEALKEQLGVKLEPMKAPMNVLVVDHVELPSEN